VLECYFDDGWLGASSDHGLTYCAALMGHGCERKLFDLRWRRVLLRHGLKELNVRVWKQTMARQKWDAGQGQAVLTSFVETMVAQDLSACVVVMDMKSWHEMPARHRRKLNGSAGEFCMQRLVRLVIDGMEVAYNNDRFDLGLHFTTNALRDGRVIAQRLYSDDSRVRHRVATIRYSELTEFGHLQAAQLLGCGALGRVKLKLNKGVQLPNWVRALPDLANCVNPSIFEYWDQSNILRYIETLD
jgi:hypothetical protein